MATYKAVMRPALEYASSIWSHLASSTSINKLQVMQNAALKTATVCTQDINIQHLHDETLILPIHEQLELQSSQYKQVPKTTAYKRWNCQVIRPANCCHLIPSNRFLYGFPVPSQFAAAKLTHYSTMPHRPSDYSRPRQRLLLSGDGHQNPGPATMYPCSVCTSNVTSRGVSYMCNRCSGWVHSKCSGLKNAAEYRRIKNWACISCSSPPTPQIPKPLPSPATTKASDGDPFTIRQFNANGIGNKQVEQALVQEDTIHLCII